MNAILLAQALVPGGVIGLAVWLIVILAVVAIVFVATKAMGVPIPQWLIQILVIVFVAIVAIVAIKFVAGL